MNASIGKASALLASGTLVSRVLGFVRVALLAQAIGITGVGADAFAVANQLPNIIFVIVAGGTLNAVLVPQIVRAKSHPDGGGAYINKLVTVALVILAVITAAATLLAPVLVKISAFAWPSDQFALAVAFAYWCLPQIFFYGLYSLLGEILNARSSFGPFTWSPVLNNIISLAGIAAFIVLYGLDNGVRTAEWWTPDRIALIGGTATLGIAAQALILFLFWRRIGLTYRPDFRWRGVGLSTAGKLAGWTFGMVIVTQLAGLVETNVVAVASGDNASTAALQTAWLIFMLPHSIIAVSLATAYFTRMSGHAAHGELADVRRDLSSSIRVISLFMVLATVVLVVVAYPFSRLFTGFDNAVLMGNVLIGFLVGLPAFSILFVIQRAFYSLNDTRTVFLIQVIQAVIFTIAALVILATVPVEWIGVAVALDLSIATIVQAGIAAFWIRHRLAHPRGTEINTATHPGGGRVVTSIAKSLIAAVPASAIGVVIVMSLGATDPLGFAVAGIPQALATMALTGAAMSVVYLGALWLLRTSELSVAVGALVNRFRS